MSNIIRFQNIKEIENEEEIPIINELKKYYDEIQNILINFKSFIIIMSNKDENNKRMIIHIIEYDEYKTDKNNNLHLIKRYMAPIYEIIELNMPYKIITIIYHLNNEYEFNIITKEGK